MRKMTKRQFDAACKRRRIIPAEKTLNEIGCYRRNGITVAAYHCGTDYAAKLAYLIREFDRLEAFRDSAAVKNLTKALTAAAKGEVQSDA